ncbi:MAG: TrmB family transcriptional regulator, partial [DPANN group archaeon]|nr:TrmB family transcriptional regulator [DPANN group archaeon]
MIVEKSFLNKLKALGLNSYEAKIWTALLSRGISSAGELSDISNVPRSRSYDVLENLEKKGFIMMKIGKPIKYIALPPEDVLERVKKTIKEEANKEAKSIDGLKNSEIMVELATLHNQGVEIVDPADLTGSLKSRGHLYSQINSLIKGAEKSIVIMTTSKGLNRKNDYFKNALERAKERGVQIKIAAPVTSESEKAAKMLGESCNLRHVDQVRGRFIIADDKELVFMLLDDKVDPTYDMGIWVNSPFFSKALTQLFNMV